MRRCTTEDFIKKSIEKFSDKFSYEQTNYINSTTKLILTCKKHGLFEILPNNHLYSMTGCGKCARELNGKNHKLDTHEFISMAKEIHGDRYDYSESIYLHSLEKVKIICKIHGEFFIKPSNHINNRQGCGKCGNASIGAAAKNDSGLILSRIFSKKNSDLYKYTGNIKINGMKQCIDMHCHKHGGYLSSPKNIIRSACFGCKKCRVESDRLSLDLFIKKSSEAHNGIYDYTKTDYLKSHSPIIVTCPRHGDFKVMPYIHISGKGFCPKCTTKVSSYEIELSNYLQNNEIDVETTFKGLDGVSEIDIISHKHRIGIEINGLYWHSDIYKDKDYHINKTKKLKALGYRLIHIFEDDWINKKEICKSIILNSLGKSLYRIFARNCIIKECSFIESKHFLQENHIQGSCVSKVRLGLFFKNELVSIMTFCGLRKSLGSLNKPNCYELVRFCGKTHTNVIGAASKLFNFFIKNYKPNYIVSYCDKSRYTGDLYKKLGFTHILDTPPNYFYIKDGKRYNRFSFRKSEILKMGAEKSDTEYNFMAKSGYSRIYDCGSMKFEWSSV